MKILTIVGARPQFIKAAMVSLAVAKRGGAVTEEILHTGQHYDPVMSEIFFEQMKIPQPSVMLECGGMSHGAMTGKMLTEIEKEIVQRKPDWVLVYGDTNSTLAGALAAAKLHVPVAHVEAGLRSYNKRMPEELNRILTDHVDSLLLCPTSVAVENLASEGIVEGVHQVGDVMYDAALLFGKTADQESSILESLFLHSGNYMLATVHRAENTDDPMRLASIFQAFAQLASQECPVVLPLHPRTAACLAKLRVMDKLTTNQYVRCIEPVSFLEMVTLEKNARLVLTDSGGIQKEAYFHGVPCVTLREETEWVETIEAGWNQLAGADTASIVNACRQAKKGSQIDEYGTGNAAKKIIKLLEECGT